MRFQTIIAVILLLAATGYGGGQAARQHETQIGYSSAAEARHSYTPYEFGSRLHSYIGEFHIGGDLEPRKPCVTSGRRTGSGISWDRHVTGWVWIGWENYEHDLITKDDTDPYGFSGNEFVPFIIQP